MIDNADVFFEFVVDSTTWKRSTVFLCPAYQEKKAIRRFLGINFTRRDFCVLVELVARSDQPEIVFAHSRILEIEFETFFWRFRMTAVFKKGTKLIVPTDCIELRGIRASSRSKI